MTHIFVQVSRDAIFDNSWVFVNDDDAERSCQEFAKQVKEELEATLPGVYAEVGVTEHKNGVRVDGEWADIGWQMTVDHLTQEVWERFAWVIGPTEE